ncbi:MAG: hypothetical protein UX88_C0003G0022 [Candidatus Woesebacteria bacterium GW2011_GWC2_47_16]|uniref:Uncharacterized protein n=8 Tax=Candidatus Woeseibacteriota TaxID=1752722 RepID=A0A0G1QS42_9BACT|nr:MAG: hypothetical protein UX03_C0004G0021 [Candidatus Woesebacteria bacterium GW2011_GWE1_45_18]KKU25018.1 MAG: hypothetical protein UX34_C0005G0022 [Candidatus Woesebacteria bacterium GW2011_GWF1_46_13]KKU47826.1 MAG: hypothetical protein UX67_C0028G0019 [Candidatus Woesebacteria bacterium GW2011_GWF2_46_8]KKU65293.1 MAG: hypothetical protein UX88_C0003G0022 [Candidatus Woesebacteria bacterium GW2011_GWC2_47_16]KKU70870.1 MAG: hypothetical protein UX95_C0011G0002 [Candidatus Woesebacteria b
MSPCEVEIRSPGSEKWIKFGRLNPGRKPVSFPNIREDQVREIILFECSNDGSETRIFRSGLEIEWESEESRRIVPDLELLQLVKTLKRGESYEMNITTDRGTRAVIRFTHVQPRLCYI